MKAESGFNTDERRDSKGKLEKTNQKREEENPSGWDAWARKLLAK